MNKEFIKRFFEVLEKYPKVVNEDEVYFPYSSIKATLIEIGDEE